MTDLKATTRLCIKRCYFTKPLTHPTVHCFADASQKAYSAVVFLVSQNKVFFVLAKYNVAHLKERTLPCLELLAALIATRLTCFVLKSMPINHQYSCGQTAK